MEQDKIYNRVLEHFYTAQELKKGEVFGVFLQGSQNYLLDTPNSDIDTKAILLPSFEDIVLNKKPVSHTHIMENNEHLDLKDIRLMFDCFKKQNVNFLEILFTPYAVINADYEDLYFKLLAAKEQIAHYNNYAALNCAVGMAKEKEKALTHPYPTLLDKIEKYGYDPKQLHHILRMKDFIEKFFKEEQTFAKSLIPEEKTREYLVKIKKPELIFPVEEAKEIARKTVEELEEYKKDYMGRTGVRINNDVEALLNEILVESIRRSFHNSGY